MAKAASTDKNVKIRELTVAAEESQLGRVRDFVVDACDEAAFSEREASNTKLAVDEACTNIIKHAYEGAEQGEILVRIEISPGDLQVSLHDKGKRFDFASVQDPDLDEYVETGRKGGLGVFLINRLMDGVEYHTDDSGNELVLSKHSQSAATRGLIAPQDRPLRGTLRFKFMMRASSGLLLLVVAIWAILFIRQTTDIGEQRTEQWMEKRRLAENLSNRGKDVLLLPDEFSLEQTNLSSYLAKLVAGDGDVAYVRVVGATGQIVSSGTIEDIFTPYREPPDAVRIGGDSVVVWKALTSEDRAVRDIGFVVRVSNTDTGGMLDLGYVHLGIYEDAVEASINDPRITTALILLAIFLVGILLVMGLVSVFVKPIQVLTDGVRAIGDGTMDTKLDIDGPAEIGAIASVFNEITNKFKKAQESVLEQEKMQKEMEVAKEIQQSLLPNRKPKVSGYDIAPLYQAAAEVGGDYYDFVEVDEDTIGVVVADVSGKGVPGSLVMTMIRTALRMEARGNKNASDVMSKMNAFVTDDMKKGMFVTMFYVILDSKNRIISYASAGHNPMILYRHETHETFFLNPKGFPVGISLPDEELFRKSISLEKIKLKKDDMLLIYTDGVTEAMNERREQYGETRLLSFIKENGHLHPEDFIANLDRDIKKFTGGYPQNDDITVVAVKEKLTADDVLYGIRKKLIDLVDIDGLSVKEACLQMRVSPATYYRYKKRLEVLGERGLKNKILRKDTVLKRVSLEARKKLLEIIVENPEYGAKRITSIYNEGKEAPRQITERMVYDELKRLNLNTKDLRIEYLRRNRLLKDEMLADADHRSGKDIIEDLLKEIPGVETADADAERSAETAGTTPVADDEPLAVEPSDDVGAEYEQIDDIGMSVSTSPDGITSVLVNGHLDSVTSTALEQRLKQLVSDGNHKFIIDLSDVTYISSGGWGIFTGEVRGLREHGGDIVLVGMSPEVYDVYELLGFDDVLKSFTNPQEAAEYFELPPEERLAVVSRPVVVDTPDLPGTSKEENETVPGESYVHEWESLKIEATTVGPSGDMVVISLNGIIDTVSAESLRAALAQIIKKDIFKIVVDMSQVEYVSSGGWGTFTERLREVRRNSGDIKLFGMDPDVYYVFTMLGFNIVLSSFDILTEAIEDFGRETHATGRPTSPLDEDAGQPEALTPTHPTGETVDLEPAPGEAPEIDLSERDVRDVAVWEDAGNGVKIAHMTGFIEASAVDELATHLMQELTDEPVIVLFDLERVEYISSTGWGQFAGCAETIQTWGGVVALYGLGPDLHDIYSCLEFQSFIKEYPDRQQAIEGARADVGTPTAASETSGPPVAPADPADPDVETYTVGEYEDPGVESVDDILGDDAGVSTPGAADRSITEPTDDQTRRWPGEAPVEDTDQAVVEDVVEDTVEEVREPDPVETAKPVRPQVSLDETPDRVPEDTDPQFVDMSDHTDVVDVGSAVSDKNFEKDERLRDIGWGDYGEKLEKRNKPKKKKQEEDD